MRNNLQQQINSLVANPTKQIALRLNYFEQLSIDLTVLRVNYAIQKEKTIPFLPFVIEIKLGIGFKKCQECISPQQS